APRDAPTMTTSEAGDRLARNSRAAASRAAADVDVMTCSIHPPERRAGNSESGGASPPCTTSVVLRRARGPPRAQLTIGIEDRSRIVVDEPELRDDFASDLFFLDLLGQEPLQLGHLGEGLLAEAQLVERVDLDRHALLVLKRLLEDHCERIECRLGLVDRL